MIFCPECGAECSDDAKFCPTCGASLVAAKKDTGGDPFIGKKIKDNFLIEEKIGEGGMGVVYKATQLGLDRPVAIKILHKHLFASDKNLALRFHREAKSASQIEHPNCIQIYDFGQIKDDGSLFIAMEFIKGRPLTDIIEQEFPIPTQRIAKILSQVCSVLAEAHSKGIIHRDMKPDNIMIIERPEEKDFVKVLDFGIAKLMDRSQPKLTMDGMVCGTPEYMSPEQAMGKELDARADIYSVGCILYEMLTQHVPFEDDSYQVILTRHVRDMPLPPSQRRPDLQIDPRLEAICMKALQKDKNARFQDCVEMKKAFDAVLEGSKGSVNVAAPSDGKTAMWTEPSQQQPLSAQPSGTMAMGATQQSAMPQPASTAERPTQPPPQPAPQQTVQTQGQQTLTVSVPQSGQAQSSVPNVTVVIPQQKSGSTALIIGVVAAVLIVAAVAAFFVFSGGKSGTKKTQQQSSVATAPVQAQAKPKVEPQKSEPAPVPEKRDPKRARKLLKEGEKQLAAGNKEQALKFLKTATYHDPKLAKAYKLIGDIQMLNQNVEEAKKAYRKYLELNPNAPEKQYLQQLLKTN